MHIGEWLHTARGEAGLSVEEATFRLRDVLPPVLWVSTKTVHRAETNPDPNPVLAAGLAAVYRKAPEDWPVELRDEIEQVAKVLDPAARRLLLKSAGHSPFPDVALTLFDLPLSA